jgi:acyl dehydratase
MTYNVYWEDVEIGQKIPEWLRKTDLMNWNRFAAVNDEFVYIHMDDDAGRDALNEPGAFGMGTLRFSYLHSMLRDWAGDEAEIKQVGCQYRAINNKNDVLRCVGIVKDKRIEDDQYLIELDIDVMNQNGQSTAPGQAIIILPSRTQ